MGKIREYQCECGYCEEVFPGYGLGAINKNMIKQIFPEEAKKIFDSDIKVNVYRLGNVLAECRHCEKIFTVPCLTYTQSDGNCFKTMGKCPECSGIIPECEDMENVNCPKCNRIMKYTITGNWD